jgi:hypothetical protein
LGTLGNKYRHVGFISKRPPSENGASGKADAISLKKANRPSSERRALEQSTLQRGTLFRFDGTFCSPPHHFVTPRNGSESGGLLCAGSRTYVNGAIAKVKFITTQIAIDTALLNHRHVAVLNDAGDEIFEAPIRSKPVS